jgi:hypothetical protein
MAKKPEDSGKLNGEEIKGVEEIDEYIRRSLIKNGKIKDYVFTHEILSKTQLLELKKRYQNSGWHNISFYTERSRVGNGMSNFLHFHMTSTPVPPKPKKRTFWEKIFNT